MCFLVLFRNIAECDAAGDDLSLQRAQKCLQEHDIALAPGIDHAGSRQRRILLDRLFQRGTRGGERAGEHVDRMPAAFGVFRRGGGRYA